MKPVVNGKAAYAGNQMMVPYVETEGPFAGRMFISGVFGDIPNSMFKAANLNLTYISSFTATGDYDKDGNFDGITGLIQRHQVDFSVFSVPLEAFKEYEQRTGKRMPVKVIRMIAEDDMHIMSHPTYNRTAIRYDIEDSIFEIKPEVMVFYLLLFGLIHIIICKILPLLHKRSGEVQHVTQTNGVGWNMVRLLLGQGSAVNFTLATQVWIFFAFECCIGILICLYMNHMSSDLVAYTKPKLLDTLQDIWDSGDEFKTSFHEDVNVAARFKQFEEGSVERKLLEKYYKQWEPLKNKKGKYYPTLGSNEFMTSRTLIKELKIAFLVHKLGAEINIGLECKGVGSGKGRPTESSLYLSKEKFMVQHLVDVFNWNIDPELENRLNIYQTRLLDHGFDDYIHRLGPEMLYNNLPIGDPVSQQCLNRKEWDDMDKEPTAFGLEACNRFLMHVTMALIPVMSTFLIECLWVKLKGYKPNTRLVRRKLQRLENQPTIRGNANQRKMEIRRRRMEAIEKARRQIEEAKK